MVTYPLSLSAVSCVCEVGACLLANYCCTLLCSVLGQGQLVRSGCVRGVSTRFLRPPTETSTKLGERDCAASKMRVGARCDICYACAAVALCSLSRARYLRPQTPEMTRSVLGTLVLAGLGVLALGPWESQGFVVITSPAVMTQFHLPQQHPQLMVGHHRYTSATTSRHWCGGDAHDGIGMFSGRSSSFLPVRRSSSASVSGDSKKLRANPAAPRMACLPGPGVCVSATGGEGILGGCALTVREGQYYCTQSRLRAANDRVHFLNFDHRLRYSTPYRLFKLADKFVQ